MLGEIHPKRGIYRRGVLEDLRKVWLQENDIRSLSVPLVVLPANATAEIIFGSHFIVLVRHGVLRMFDALQQSLLGR